MADGDSFGSFFQNPGDNQWLIHGLYIPAEAVGILSQGKQFPVIHQILGKQAAFEAKLALVIQIQLQAGDTHLHIRLGFGAIGCVQVPILGEGNGGIPGPDLAILIPVDQVEFRRSPQHHFIRHYFFVLKLRQG